MTDDLVKRLRGRRIPYDCGQFTAYDTDPDCNAAADRIEDLERQIKLRDLFLVENGLWEKFVKDAGEKENE